MPKSAKSTGTVSGLSSQIAVTVQQSRFAKDAVDAPNSKEIDVPDLTISVGGKEILDHVRLRIREGVHYVLAGRNGVGKSTLLRALAEGRIPGVPANLQVLLLGQTLVSAHPTQEQDSVEAETVLQHVVSSDVKRRRAMQEAEALSKALDDADDPLAAVSTLRRIQLERAQQDLLEKQQAASRRSGARGLKARQVLTSAEKSVDDAETLAQADDDAIEQSDLQSELQQAVSMLDELQLSLEAMDASGTESRARKILLGLGFAAEKLERPYTSLSGGWRSRCDLACALTQRPDVLLLDEPTNFLDLFGILWLQNYINDSLRQKSVVVVTHDRAFADTVGEELIVLKANPPMKLDTFKGTLSDYMLECRKQIKYMTRMKDAQDRQAKHMQDSISANISAAKRTGDDKKLKQAVSRKKKLDDRMGLEVSAKGTKFKRSRDMMGYYLSSRSAIEIPDMDPPVSITLPEGPARGRISGALVSLEKVSYSYPGSRTETFKDVDFVIHPGERVGIVGLNGSGKTTLTNLIMAGEDGPMKPRKGTVTRHSRATFSVFSQHAVEALQAEGERRPTHTALAEVLEFAQSASSTADMTEQAARALLAELGLRGQSAAQVPIRALSGGQKVRVALAKATMTAPDLLILDEVTTHLDADTIDALVDGLEDWKGALMVVTHDRVFMRAVVEGEREEVEEEEEEDGHQGKADHDSEREPGVVYRVRNGLVKKLEGGMRRYEELMEKVISKSGA